MRKAEDSGHLKWPNPGLNTHFTPVDPGSGGVLPGHKGDITARTRCQKRGQERGFDMKD